MDASAVSARIEAGLKYCSVEVEGGGGKFQVTVVGAVFEGLTPVKRQQLVYATLKDPIADGSVHAVSIRTFTPEQWAARGG